MLVGVGVGVAEGADVGVLVGVGVGVAKGADVGVLVGVGVGVAEGADVGVLVGVGVGVAEGADIGVLVGVGVGVAEGADVGVLVGVGIGVVEGADVGVLIDEGDSSRHAARDMATRTVTRPINITWRTPCRNRVPIDNLELLIYTANLNRKLKVLDFIQYGGPILTVDRTVFEMWLGAL